MPLCYLDSLLETQLEGSINHRYYTGDWLFSKWSGCAWAQVLGHHCIAAAVLPGCHLLAQCDSLIHRLQLDSAKLNSWPSLKAGGDGFRASNGVQGTLLHCTCSISSAGLSKLLNSKAFLKQQVAINKGRGCFTASRALQGPSHLLQLVGSASGQTGQRHRQQALQEQVCAAHCTPAAGTSHSTTGWGTTVACSRYVLHTACQTEHQSQHDRPGYSCCMAAGLHRLLRLAQQTAAVQD